MNTFISIVTAIVSLLTGFIVTVVIHNTYVHSARQSSTSMSQTVDSISTVSEPFILKPPAQSLKGTLFEKIGSVQHKTRDANAFVDATPSATILVGESIATGDDGIASVQIPNLCSIKFEKNSEISFVNLFTENSVFQQKSGKILYTIVPDKTIAIRALHTLFESKDSTFSVNIIDTDIVVISEKGIVKIAIVDTDNSTHVYTLAEGKRANIDDASRTVSIESPRK